MISNFQVQCHHTLDFYDFPSFIIISLGLLPKVWQSITLFLWSCWASWTKLITACTSVHDRNLVLHVEEKLFLWRGIQAVSQERESQCIGTASPTVMHFSFCLSQKSSARHHCVYVWQQFSKCGPWRSIGSTTWEMRKIQSLWPHLWPTESRTPQAGLWKLCFSKPSVWVWHPPTSGNHCCTSLGFGVRPPTFKYSSCLCILCASDTFCAPSPVLVAWAVAPAFAVTAMLTTLCLGCTHLLPHRTSLGTCSTL